MQTELDNGVSLFRNLYIDNKTRNPKVKGTNDFINNVVYNWGGGGGYIAGDSSGPSEANIIGNYFIGIVTTQKLLAMTVLATNLTAIVLSLSHQLSQSVGSGKMICW